MTAEQIIEAYKLQAHPEGGYFAELYTAPLALGSVEGERPLGGSIYFLLKQQDISHFHVIDCEELWYYHSGCGLQLYLLSPEGRLETRRLGLAVEQGEAPMVVIPKGYCFAAENLDQEGYTFVSCVTMPRFRYEGFRLVPYEELQQFGVERRLCLE